MTSISPPLQLFYFFLLLIANEHILHEVYVDALSQSSISNAAATLRICQGSSCASKCRGAFDPKKSLERLMEGESRFNVEFEESFCMNQCKRGPNIRMIRNGQVVVFDGDDGIMNDTEKNRKTFQNVATEERIEKIWGLTKGLVDGSVHGTECGSVEKLSDIMPER